MRELEAAAVAYEEDSEMVTYGDPRIRARKSDEYRAKAEQIRIAKAVANFIKRLSKKEGKVKSESSGVPCVTIG
ncbi:MAG: hypothetical protein Q7K35_00800 [bacterium]|nr:hypothetical protein [bacterium]